jgi:hypothetical protein
MAGTMIQGVVAHAWIKQSIHAFSQMDKPGLSAQQTSAAAPPVLGCSCSHARIFPVNESDAMFMAEDFERGRLTSKMNLYSGLMRFLHVTPNARPVAAGAAITVVSRLGLTAP